MNTLLNQTGFFASCLHGLSIPDFRSDFGMLQMNYLLQPAVWVMSQRTKELDFFL